MLLLLACDSAVCETGTHACDTVTRGDSGADSGDTGGDSGVDSGTARSGAESRYGSGLVGEGYDGVEEWALVADNGTGADVCRLDFSLGSSTARTDCADCSWAYDLVVSGTTVVDEDATGCAATLADPATFDGTVVSYGYAPNYFGHAQVLMVYESGAWNAVSFGGMDDTTGEFSYQWDVGYRAY